MRNISGNSVLQRIDDKTGIAGTKTSIIYSALLLFAFWALLRALFFEGLFGFDDIHYIRYALQWDRLPVNHWEARIFFNFLLRLCFSIFGFSEFVSTLPTLLASLVFMYCVFYVGLHLWPVRYALFAGLLAAILPLDVISSTAVEILTLANMFAALGIACIITAKKDWQNVMGGVFLGLSFYSHETLLLYCGILALVLWGYRWPEFRRKRTNLIIGTAILVGLFANFASFYWLSGDPLYQVKVASKSASAIVGTYVPFLLPSGNINPYWLIWPLQHFLISKSFGILLGIPVLLILYSWKSQKNVIRLLCLLIILHWAWINYGTISVLKFTPLDHTTRYWYPVALPACILATQVLFGFRRKLSKVAYSTAIFVLPLLFLVSSGLWGQNIEITKELMIYAAKHRNTTFVTDKYSLDEMFILNGAKPPQNVFSIKNFIQPVFFNIPEKYQQDSTNPDIVFMYNEQNMWREFAIEFNEYVKKNVRLNEISGKEYRLIAYCMPKSIRTEFNWLLRKPSAQIGQVK